MQVVSGEKTTLAERRQMVPCLHASLLCTVLAFVFSAALLVLSVRVFVIESRGHVCGSIALRRQVIASDANLRPPGGMSSESRSATASMGIRIDDSDCRCKFRDSAPLTGTWKCCFNHG